MNLNKVLIVYSKWVLILSHFIVLFVVSLSLINGKSLGSPHKLEISLDVNQDDFSTVESMISVKPEYSDKVKSLEPYGGTRPLEIDMDGSVFTGSVLLLVIKTILVIGFLHLLLLIVKSTERKEFFSVKNVLRIRLIGFGLMGWAVLERMFDWYTTYLADKYLMSDYLKSTRMSIPIVPDIFGSTFIIGLIVLIVAQAFDYGLKLEKEQELTI